MEGKSTSAELDALVGKLVNAFLETRWVWPRQFVRMGPCAFVLSDPRTKELDKSALQALSRELQLKLFGVHGSGEVALLVYEGDEMEVHRFANLAPDMLNQLVNGEGGVIPPFEGQLCRLTDKGVNPISIAEPVSKAPSGPAVSFSTPRFERNYQPVYRGLYFLPSRRFFANMALCKPLGAATLRDNLVGAQVLPGVPTAEFDEACVESAASALGQGRVEGQLFVPLNFSSLVRPAGRRAYEAFLTRLPVQQRTKLAAAIYETPRDPSFFALSQIGASLAAHFSQISLLVSDPGFEIEKLNPGSVSSVILTLADTDKNDRMAAIRRFIKNSEAYKRKQVWPGVAGIVNRTELELCVELRVPAISGPAVSDLSSSPVGTVQREAASLPVRAAS
jgi:hypothetical protein